MKRAEINISYTELKSIYNKVLSFTNTETPWFKNINSKTKIEKNLELYGIDNEAFFERFSNQFSVDFSQVDYRDYFEMETDCLLYTSPSPRDGLLSRMPSSA